MSGEPQSPGEWTAWARQHHACYEVQPLVSLREGQRLQVGFTANLYAALPMDLSPGPETVEAGRKLLVALRALASTLTPREDSGARVEIETPRAEAVLRPEGGMRPEVRLSLQIVHSRGYFTSVTGVERAAMGRLDGWFAERGLRKGHW